MKNLILLSGVTVSIVISLIISCSENQDFENFNEENNPSFPQIWTLAKMTSGMSGVETSGSEMLWQEEYILNANSTVIKRRIHENMTVEITGTFTQEEMSDGIYLTLIYEEKHDIIGSCTGDAMEYLKVDENTLNSTWNACDGPGLIYKRVF